MPLYQFLQSRPWFPDYVRRWAPGKKNKILSENKKKKQTNNKQTNKQKDLMEEEIKLKSNGEN